MRECLFKMDVDEYEVYLHALQLCMCYFIV